MDIIEINCENNEETTRAMTADEVAAHEAVLAEAQARDAAIAAAQAQRQADIAIIDAGPDASGLTAWGQAVARVFGGR